MKHVPVAIIMILWIVGGLYLAKNEGFSRADAYILGGFGGAAIACLSIISED